MQPQTTDPVPFPPLPSPPELTVLRDGSRAVLAEIRPEHAPLLVEGFSRLSARSRQLRFFTPKLSLSPREIAYLTRVDGYRHYALGAAIRTSSGWRGAAVARYVELEAGIAEPALTVVDAYQGLGLGSLLFERLVEAAVSRGYPHFRAEVLAENRAMLRILERTSAGLEITRGPDCLTVEVPLSTEHSERGSGVFPLPSYGFDEIPRSA